MKGVLLHFSRPSQYRDRKSAFSISTFVLKCLFYKVLIKPLMLVTLVTLQGFNSCQLLVIHRHPMSLKWKKLKRRRRRRWLSLPGLLPWWFLNMCSTCPLTCMYKIQYILASGELGFTWFQGENPLSFPQQLTMSYALNSKLKTKDFVTTGAVSEGQILQWNSCCNLASNSYGQTCSLRIVFALSLLISYRKELSCAALQDQFFLLCPISL